MLIQPRVESVFGSRSKPFFAVLTAFEDLVQQRTDVRTHHRHVGSPEFTLHGAAIVPAGSGCTRTRRAVGKMKERRGDRALNDAVRQLGDRELRA